MPNIKKLREVAGPAGEGVELLVTPTVDERVDTNANIGNWFLTCPRQAIWSHYVMSLIHLRPIAGGQEPEVRVPGATHELMMFALDPQARPNFSNIETWRFLRPFNVIEQFAVATDDDALDVFNDAAVLVLAGELWAEPPLTGQVEPWRSWLRSRAEKSVRCLACGHALWHHQARNRCLFVGNVEGGQLPCVCLRFVEKLS